ncbi:tetratricopeptide repeat protein [Methanococcoides methylutens]
MSHNDNYVGKLIEDGDELFSIKKYEEAIDAYNKALEMYPKDQSAWESKGNAHFN